MADASEGAFGEVPLCELNDVVRLALVCYYAPDLLDDIERFRHLGAERPWIMAIISNAFAASSKACSAASRKRGSSAPSRRHRWATIACMARFSAIRPRQASRSSLI